MPPGPGMPPPGGTGTPPYGPPTETGMHYGQPDSGAPYQPGGPTDPGMPYQPGGPPGPGMQFQSGPGDPGMPYGPDSAPPTTGWGPPPVPPPRSSKLSGGAIAGIVAGACALLLVVVCGIGAIVHFASAGSDKAAEARASASAAEASESASPSYSPSPESYSPTDEYIDPTDLDDEDTDPVPFELDSIFPDDAGGYTLDSEGFYSACSDAGDSNTSSLLRKYNCGNMATADYPDSSSKLLASAMVIPLPTASDASGVESGLDGQSAAFNGLSYFCPKSGASSHLCDDGASPRWRAYYGAFHRYMIIVTVLRYDGALPGNGKADPIGNAVFQAIEDHLLGDE